MAKLEFSEISHLEATPLVSRWHYAPMPAYSVVCFGVSVESELVAAAVFDKCSNKLVDNLLEFVCFGKHPLAPLQMSQLVTYCCKQLKQRGYHLLITFCEDVKGDGGVFRGSTWFYEGRRAWSKTTDRMAGERHPEGRFHLYWKNLTPDGLLMAKQFDLRELPYPKKNPLWRKIRN